MSIIYHASLTEIISKMDSAMPNLEAVLKQVEKFVEEESKHCDHPYIIDVILPMLCSYLPFWWNQGPDNVNPSEGYVVVSSSPHNLSLLLLLFYLPYFS